MWFLMIINLIVSMLIGLVMLVCCKPKNNNIRNPNSIGSKSSVPLASQDLTKQNQPDVTVATTTPAPVQKSVTKSKTLSNKSVSAADPMPPSELKKKKRKKSISPPYDGPEPIYMHDGTERDYDMELTIFTMKSLEERFSAFLAIIEEADRMLASFGVAFYDDFNVIVSDIVRKNIEVDSSNPELMRMRLFAIENRKRFRDPPSIREQVERYQSMDLTQCYVHALRTSISIEMRRLLIDILPEKALRIIKESKATDLAKMKHPMPMFIRIHEGASALAM